ncbi:MAG: hypothetical protein DMG76_24210, partial [Acidobacteria bacterium]
MPRRTTPFTFTSPARIFSAASDREQNPIFDSARASPAFFSAPNPLRLFIDPCASFSHSRANTLRQSASYFSLELIRSIPLESLRPDGGAMPAHFPRHAILLALSLTTINFPAAAQDASPAPAPSTTSATADDAYQAQRKFAMALLNQQKHIEALPVFESLAKQNPNDADVLFGWGACLINHSATVSDPNAAKTERIHARQLLIRAKELGNKSALLANLLDLVPEDGSVGFSSASETDAAMRAGESAFAKNDYDEAIKHYSHALELDPKNYHAALFVGDSYFAQKDFPNAVVWYDRAIALDSNIETAYRYEADLYVKSGEMEKARTRSIQAVVANPYSQIT